MNPLPLVRHLYDEMTSFGVLPEYEIFEAGMIASAIRLYEDSGASHHQHFDFVLGVPGALPAWDGVIGFLADRLPARATWSATGIGRAHLPVLEQTLELGGHVRTGFEDVRYLEPGKLASSNAELIARVVEIARSSGREIATPDEARSLLGLS
jgi:3-keto-5-aminohexanoate cleavage enzyme